MSRSHSQVRDIFISERTRDTPIRGLSLMSLHIQSRLSLKCHEIVPKCPYTVHWVSEGFSEKQTPSFGARQ